MFTYTLVCYLDTYVYTSAVHTSHFPLQEPGESTVHLLPFMLPVSVGPAAGEEDLRGLYRKVRKAMLGIQELNHKNNIRELERIAAEWSVEQFIIFPSLSLLPNRRTFHG